MYFDKTFSSVDDSISVMLCFQEICFCRCCIKKKGLLSQFTCFVSNDTGFDIGYKIQPLKLSRKEKQEGYNIKATLFFRHVSEKRFV